MFRKELYDLYRVCFPEDTQSYLNFFLDRKYDGTNVLIVRDKQSGVLQNMLFLVEKTIHLRGAEFYIPYMTAGATLPVCRGRGIFNRVLQECFADFARRKIPLTGLMPSAHSFYERQSFVTHAYTQDVSFKKGKKKATPLDYEHIPEMIRLYKEFCKGKSGYFVRDAKAFKLRIDEFISEGGVVLGFFAKNKLKAFLFAFSEEECDEYCGPVSAADGFDLPFDTLPVFCAAGEGAPQNMLRVCDNRLLLSKLKYNKQLNMAFTLHVTDPFFPDNDQVFSVQIESGRAKTAPAVSAGFTLTVEQFSLLVLGSYVSGTFPVLLEEAFPPLINCPVEKF